MFEIVIEEHLWLIRGSYRAKWSSSLMNAKWHSVVWQNTMTTLDRSVFIPMCDLLFLPNSTFNWLMRGFHRTFATGVAYWQGRLTPPDTWFCPIWDLQMLFCWANWQSIMNCTSYRIWLLSWIWHHHFMSLFLVVLLAEFDMTEYRFLLGICKGCGMLIGDAYSSGHLVPSHFGACICSTCWYQSFPRTCPYFSGLCTSNTPRCFLNFA